MYNVNWVAPTFGHVTFMNNEISDIPIAAPKKGYMTINQVMTVLFCHKSSAKAIVNIDNPVNTANKLAIRLAPNLSAISPPIIVPAIPAVTAHPPVTAIYSASLH